MSETVFCLNNISKTFPGVKALSNIDFDLKKGEIHCICGENGAGKSTLIKILSGAYQPDSGGTIEFEGKVTALTPHTAMKMGIQTIYQEHTLFPLLTVYENLFVGNEIAKGVIISRPKMVAKAEEVLQYLRSTLSPFDIVGHLGSGAQKTVEIAKGLVQESKVIILDEPTSSFSQTEIGHLLSIIKKLAQDGISIIYISHHLEEVFQVADRVTIIRDGRKINTYDICELDEPMLIREMVGRDVSMFYKREEVEKGEIIYEAKGVSGNGVVNADLYVRRGELLGIAGMVGSGRTELAELLFGVKKADKGVFKINGKNVRLKTPKSSIANKMSMITENRQEGLFLKHSLVRNIAIAKYSLTKTPIARPQEDIKLAQHYIESLGIVTPSALQQAVFLSGGNQQKVILAKWFATKADIFIFDEPTRGIDVGAKEEIYKLMVELLKQEKAIIMISSDMPELIAMSDRVMVMRNGSMVAEVDKHEVSEENILKHSIGGKLK